MLKYLQDYIAVDSRHMLCDALHVGQNIGSERKDWPGMVIDVTVFNFTTIYIVVLVVVIIPVKYLMCAPFRKKKTVVE